MKTCLINCRPGDIIVCVYGNQYLVVAPPGPNGVMVKATWGHQMAGCFPPDSINVIGRIIKKIK